MQRISIINSSEQNRRLRLEPWGDEVDLVVGGSVTIKASGPKEGVLEFEQLDDGITLYGWEGSILEIEDSDLAS